MRTRNRELAWAHARDMRLKPDMKYVMKRLKHNGINLPQYDYRGFSMKVMGHPIKLHAQTEQMAVAWVRKEQSLQSPPDHIFFGNFSREFLGKLKAENPSLPFLDGILEAIPALNDGNARSLSVGKFGGAIGLDLSEIKEYLVDEQAKKLNMTKEEKKKLAEERRAKRETLKKTYGWATVDDKEIEVANYTAEPSCLFAGRGDHPKRGMWKEGPQQSDIILNLSPDSPTPPGNWKGRVWEPDKMYVAKWEDKLSGKTKYIWFSDSTFMKQMREKEKFKKAEKLGNRFQEIEKHIMKNLSAEEENRRKMATVCWLISNVNLRVGDEKDPGEADTVGAITLRPEHIRISGNLIHFDFLGKDAVRWTKEVSAPLTVIENVGTYSKTCKEYLFEGIDSSKVARFFSERMEGLTAKVFRTWRCTQTVEKSLSKCQVRKEDPEYTKRFCAKTANLEAAKVANHKRKIPAKFDERLKEKEERLKELESTLKAKEKEGRATETIRKRVEMAKLEIGLTRETKEYNLGTSLKSYIDPMTYVRWAKQIDFNLEKFYPKTLRSKYSWALK